MTAIEEKDLDIFPANIVFSEPLPEVVEATLAAQLAILDIPEIET